MTKKIEAIIREEALNDVMDALRAIGEERGDWAGIPMPGRH